MQKGHIASTVVIPLILVLAATSLSADLKPRIIVLTDISPISVEPDDMESMIRTAIDWHSPGGCFPRRAPATGKLRSRAQTRHALRLRFRRTQQATEP